MSNQAGSPDIAAYLSEVKRLLSAEKYDFVLRRKNIQALAQYGFTITDAKNEILERCINSEVIVLDSCVSCASAKRRRSYTRACLKIAFRQMCVTICGRFGSNEGRIAGYVT